MSQRKSEEVLRSWLETENQQYNYCTIIIAQMCICTDAWLITTKNVYLLEKNVENI
jgi:hypothetical protein